MKRVIALLLILMCVIGAAGCQKTPESPIVVGKNHEQMIEQAVSGEKTDDSAAQQVGAIERYVIDEPLKNAAGNLEVYIDAEVVAPSSSSVTTAKVGRHSFNEEECEQYVSVLFEGQKTYSGEVLLSKKHTQDRILELKKELAMETDEEKKTRLQGTIEKYEMSLGFMAEGEGFVETPVEFVIDGLYNGESLYLVSDGSDGIYRAIEVRNDDELRSYSLRYEASTNDYPSIMNVWSATISGDIRRGAAEYGDPKMLPGPQISEAEAIAEADTMLDGMGITDFACNDTDVVFGSINGAVQKAYRLSYTRKIADVPFNFNSGNTADFGSGSLIDDGKGGYIPVWEDEKMTFIVTDDGIVQFEWLNPYDVLEVVTENTAMMDFESIMNVFKKMILVVNADVPEGTMNKIEISRIELGLMRVLEPNSLDTGVIIPVWDFYGKNHGKMDREEWLLDDPNEPYLTINAIDGSIIDRSAGY